MNKLAKVLLVLTTALVALNLQQAKGGIISPFVSDLDAGNTAISGFTGPYGFVVVMLTSTTTRQRGGPVKHGWLERLSIWGCECGCPQREREFV